MAEFESNVWAPWRMEYINSIHGAPAAGCFLCAYRDDPVADAGNYVLSRSERVLVMLNRYPYSNGHVLISPASHVPTLDRVPEAELTEMMLRIRDTQRVLAKAVRADGFNIGANISKCAGAGLPDHVHFHVVPRWNGDTNFMPVVGNARVLPQSLDAVRDEIVRAAAEVGVRL